MSTETEVLSFLLGHLPPSWTLEELTCDLPLMRGGVELDSVRVVELVCACEDRFGVEIDPLALGEEPTVGSFVRLIHDSRPT